MSKVAWTRKRPKSIWKRRRDGLWTGTYPDDGWFYRGVTAKAVCFRCRKVWRAPAGLLPRNNPPANCPQCGAGTARINPMARVPRRRNIKAWRVYEAARPK